MLADVVKLLVQCVVQQHLLFRFSGFAFYFPTQFVDVIPSKGPFVQARAQPMCHSEFGRNGYASIQLFPGFLQAAKVRQYLRA